MIYVIFGIVLLGSNLCMMFLAGANADKNYKNGYEQARKDFEVEKQLKKEGK